MQKLEHTRPLRLEKWKGSHPPSLSSPQVLPASDPCAEREMEGEQRTECVGEEFLWFLPLSLTLGPFSYPTHFWDCFVLLPQLSVPLSRLGLRRNSVSGGVFCISISWCTFCSSLHPALNSRNELSEFLRLSSLPSFYYKKEGEYVCSTLLPRYFPRQ